jgi:hypothetical protein
MVADQRKEGAFDDYGRYYCQYDERYAINNANSRAVA